MAQKKRHQNIGLRFILSCSLAYSISCITLTGAAYAAETESELSQDVNKCEAELSCASPEFKIWKVSNFADSLCRRAGFYEKIGKMELAEADLNRAVQLKPEYNLDRRARFYEKIRKMELAEADWNRAVQLSPEYDLNDRALFYEKIGKMELAEADLNRAVQLDPKQYLDDRALFYEKIGKMELAEADWNRAVQLSPEYYLDDRALFYEKIGKMELAEADLNRAVQLDPKQYLDDRALFYEKIGKMELAEADWNRAVQLKPEYNLDGRAEFYEKIGKMELAEADWNRAVQLKPEWCFDSFDGRAKFYERSGKFEQALRDLDSKYRDGRSPLALERALLLLRMEKKELAERELKEIIQLRCKDYEPDSNALASCFLALGQPKLAVDSLAKFQYPGTDPSLTLAIAYDRLSKKKEAAAIYANILSKSHDYAKVSVERARDCEYARQRLVALGVKPAYGPFALASNCKQPIQETLTLGATSIAAIPSSNSSSMVPTTSVRTPSSGSTASNSRVRDKWALVVGISKFANPTFNLNYAAKDARDFYNFLVNEANFKKDHVLLLLDERATRAGIMNAFGDNFLPAVSQDGDLVVVFISTHGTPAKRDKGGRNYVVAHDTQLSSLYSTGVDMDELYRRIKEGVKTERALILMDTCFSGAGVPGAKALNLADNFDANEVAQGCGHLVITSSSPNERSWESKMSANGVFTKYLIQSLRGNNMRIDVKSAFADLQKKVAWEVQNAFGEKQTPQLGGEWEGRELILSVPCTEPRPILNPDLLREIEAGEYGLQKPTGFSPAGIKSVKGVTQVRKGK